MRADIDIIVVEDSDDDFEATLRALDVSDEVGLQVVRCKSGSEAWEYLNAGLNDPLDAALLKRQFVILDLNMPGLDGRGLLSLIKSHERLKSIPIAILTTSDDPVDVQECYRNGANTFVKKPVNWRLFVDRMDALKNFWFANAELPQGL